MLQGTIGIENLKVTDKSLAKKAAFTEADKENLDVAVPVVGIPDIDDEVAADETKEATTGCNHQEGGTARAITAGESSAICALSHQVSRGT